MSAGEAAAKAACPACEFWTEQANGKAMLCPDHVAALRSEVERWRGRLDRLLFHIRDEPGPGRPHLLGPCLAYGCAKLQSEADEDRCALETGVTADTCTGCQHRHPLHGKVPLPERCPCGCSVFGQATTEEFTIRLPADPNGERKGWKP